MEKCAILIVFLFKNKLLFYIHVFSCLTSVSQKKVNFICVKEALTLTETSKRIILRYVYSKNRHFFPYIVFNVGSGFQFSVCVPEFLILKIYN